VGDGLLGSVQERRQGRDQRLPGQRADYDDARVSLTAEVARTHVVYRTFQEFLQQAQGT
jgi:hypothetical protein